MCAEQSLVDIDLAVSRLKVKIKRTDDSILREIREQSQAAEKGKKDLVEAKQTIQARAILHVLVAGLFASTERTRSSRSYLAGSTRSSERQRKARRWFRKSAATSSRFTTPKSMFVEYGFGDGCSLACVALSGTSQAPSQH